MQSEANFENIFVLLAKLTGISYCNRLISRPPPDRTNVKMMFSYRLAFPIAYNQNNKSSLSNTL